ncbi:hypothetical protein GQ53DRAFT_817696 [Thozetella sp. PMI_491]|nr:hypothetical protein GQ53DRAFT_817696 [Thozetella sp. PMI_491]
MHRGWIGALVILVRVLLGIISTCNLWYLAKAGDTCQGIADFYHLTLVQFFRWNPATGVGCTDLWANEAYCVGVPTTGTTTGVTISTASATTTKVTPPGPTQSGIPANCNAFALTQSGDGCWDFASRNSITLDQLYAWNPVLNDNCENFWAGEAYCIGVS